MNSTSSKVFLVIVTKCENRSHAGKIASLLRGFPHREYGQTDAQYGETDAPSIRFMTMVKADSLASIQTAIAPRLGKAKAEIGEMSLCPTIKCHLNHSISCALSLQQVYEVRPRRDKRGVNLISAALLFRSSYNRF